jgi:hypothetical protein
MLAVEVMDDSASQISDLSSNLSQTNPPPTLPSITNDNVKKKRSSWMMPMTSSDNMHVDNPKQEWKSGN